MRKTVKKTVAALLAVMMVLSGVMLSHIPVYAINNRGLCETCGVLNNVHEARRLQTMITIESSQEYEIIGWEQLPEGVVPIEMTEEEFEAFLANETASFYISHATNFEIGEQSEGFSMSSFGVPTIPGHFIMSMPAAGNVTQINFRVDFDVDSRNGATVAVRHCGFSMTGITLGVRLGHQVSSSTLRGGRITSTGWAEVNHYLLVSGGIRLFSNTVSLHWTWHCTRLF